MNYLIPIKKITKLINPFENDGVFPFFEKTEVERLLSTNDIFVTKEDNSQTQLNKQLAYEIANYELKEITISLEEGSNFNHLEDIIKGNLINLVAAIYLKEENIVAQIKDPHKMSKKLLGVNLDEPDNIEIKQPKEVENFIWTVSKGLVKNTWGDTDFIINKLKSAKYKEGEERKEIIDEIIKLTDPDLWKDAAFIELLLNEDKYFINNMPEDFVYQNGCLNILIKDPEMFQVIWHDTYKDIFIEYKKDPTFLIEAPNEIKETIKQIEVAFLDEVFVHDILLTSSYDHKTLYSFLKDEIKYSKVILDLIYLEKITERTKVSIEYQNVDRIYLDPHGDIPDIYKNDYNWIKVFINDYAKQIQFDRIPGIGSYDEHKFDVLLNSWINDKEKIMDMVNSIEDKHFYHIYKKLPKSLKKDKDIINVLIDKNIDFFHLLSEKEQAIYLIKYIEETENLENWKSPHIFKIQDIEILKKIIDKGNCNWLTYDECDKKWQINEELIKYIWNNENQNIKKTRRNLIDVNSIFKIIRNDKTMLYQLIDDMPSVYGWLPIDKKNDPELALKVLENNIDADVLQSLYSSRQFCIEVLSKGISNHIPQGYWYEKDFLLQICNQVDMKKISSNVFSIAPKEINQLFEAYGINQQYEKFVNNYILNLELTKNLNTTEKTIGFKKVKI